MLMSASSLDLLETRIHAAVKSIFDDARCEAYTSDLASNIENPARKTLILGHGRLYTRKDIHCSPIDADEWFHDPFVCLDAYEDVQPDIVFSIGQSRSRVWTFAEDNSYDRIIDCTGGAISHGNSAYCARRLNPELLEEIYRVLTHHGVFYTDIRMPRIYQKDGNTLKEIKKTLQEGTMNHYLVESTLTK